jgi:hypothetical protein
MHGLFDGSLLAPATLAQLLDLSTSAGLPGTNECEPGTALSVGQRSTAHGDAWFHGGFAGYFRAWAEYLPSAQASVVVMVNSSGPVTPIIDALEAAGLGPPAGAPPARAGDCNVDIELRTPDGDTRRLTTDAAFDGFPSLAPDGRIAWISNRDGPTDLFVMAADGSGQLNLTADPAHDLFPRWSPDGSTIAYSSDADGDQEIYVLAADGSSRRQLTNNSVDDMLPAWSPDGGSIAYTTMGAGRDVHVMQTDGGGDRPVVAGPEDEWWPAWSDDGTQIVYESNGVLYVVPSGGGQAVRVAVPQLRVTLFPAWAPGTDILLSSDFELYETGVDGSGLRRLTSTSAAEEAMAGGVDGSIVYQVSRWQPDP